MWERQLSIPGMGNEDQDGTTCRIYSEKYQLEAVARFECSSNLLQVSMRNGDYVYQSESLVASPLLEPVGTAHLLREALERWLLLATLPYSKQTSGLTPLELTTLLYRQIEHLLA